MRSIISLSILLSAVFSLYAQTGTVKGIVTSKDGSPLAYAHITIKDKNLASFTSESGTFDFKEIPTGTQAIQVTSVGFESQEIHVLVQENQTIEVNFTLAESAHELDEVVVRSTQGLNERAVAIGKVPI